MKISALISLLQRRMAKHGDVTVYVSWEGTKHDIAPTTVYATRAEGRSGGTELRIDADDHLDYKDEAIDPHEGEDGR